MRCADFSCLWATRASIRFRSDQSQVGMSAMHGSGWGKEFARKQQGGDCPSLPRRTHPDLLAQVNKFSPQRGAPHCDNAHSFSNQRQASDPIQRAVLVESPIDAMSFAVLDRTDSRKTIYLSTDGSGTVPLEFLRTLPTKSVIVAYDNDRPGNLMAQTVMEQLPNAVRKLSKAIDWNQELKNMFNLEQQQNRQRENERQQSRGFSL